MKSIIIVWIISLSISSSSPGDDGGPKRPPTSPNIVFILLDAARADHFSSYGYDKKTTPAIDALGRNGVIFLKNFVHATETYESIPLILTSRYLSRPIFQMDTWEWGIKRESPRTIFNKFDDQQILLSSLLSQSGYRTAIFHNHPWFVEKTDLVKSFDESFLFPIKDNDPVDDRMVDAVIAWVKKHKKERFFIYYHMMSPHQPYPPKNEDLDFIDREELPLLNATREKFENRKGGNAQDWSAEELNYYGVMYDSNLKHTDSQIGRLYSGLNDLGLEDTTLFIITSDHGELLGQHGELGHGGPPWDALIHVPLIMVWSPGIPKGMRIGGLTESVDIVPTIIDICGLKLPPDKSLDGVSLRGFFPGPSSGKEAVYTNRSIRTPDYKYIVDRDLLFDLRKDPGEENNISNTISPGVRKKLKNLHELFLKDFKSRYQDATRETAPEFPFYFTIREFTLRPKNIYASQGTEISPIEMLNNNPSGKRWLLNSSDRKGYLICLPGKKRAPPLTLSSSVPEGSYRISLMVTPLNEPFPAPEKSAFLVRIGSSGLFKEPMSIKTIPGEEGEPPSYELEYGMLDVKETKFSLDLDFQPPEGSPFLIFYVAFSPPLADPEKDRSILAGEAEQRKKDLRSLGYLQ